MADVFLMGTAGRADDPHRSPWREPIKIACTKAGITYFDPVVNEWDDEAMRREVEALATARVLVMAVTADTAGVASLAESGWAALSALLRKQSVGLYIDQNFKGEKITQSTVMVRLDTLLGRGPETIEVASRRARKLVNSHATKLATQFPGLNIHVAKDLDELARWTVETAHRMISGAKRATQA